MPTSELKYVRHPEAPADAPPVAVRAGELIFVGGQLPVHPVTGLPEETLLSKGMPFHGSLIEKQLRYLYDTLDGHLKKLGTSLKRILKINSFHLHGKDVDMALRARRNWFDHEAPPPSTLVFTPELPARDARVLIDMINVADDASLPMTAVTPTKSPPIAQVKSIGWAVFSQVIKGGGFVFTRGTTAHNQDGPLPEILPDRPFPYSEDQVQFQLRYEMERMKDLLEDAGCSMKDVVRAELHMTNMSDIAAVDEIWEEYFPKDPPARVIIPVPLVVLPMRIETELIAVDPKGPYRKKTIKTKKVPARRGPEPHAIKAGPYVFLSGQMATDYKNGLAKEAQGNPNFPFHSSPSQLEAEYIINNVEEILKAADTSIDNLVKRRVHHVDLANMPRAEAPWRNRIGDRIPPTSEFKTSGPLPIPGCTVQYDLIAYAP